MVFVTSSNQFESASKAINSIALVNFTAFSFGLSDGRSFPALISMASRSWRGNSPFLRRGAAIDLAAELAGARTEKIQKRLGFDFVGKERGVFEISQTILQVEGEVKWLLGRARH